MKHETNLCGEKFAALRPSNRVARFLSGIAVLVIALSAMTGLLSPPLHAQVGTGDILGTVTDSTGAVVVGAKVTVKNLGTAEARTDVTDSKGEYTFNGLANGTYTLKVESKGFKIFAVSNILLSTGDRSRYNASLTTGAVSETVEVTASTAVMQADSSEITSTVEQKAVADLPLNGRSLEQAIQVQPGLTYAQNGNNQNDRRASFDIAPASGGTNNEMVDSFDNNERNLGLDGVRPSVDSVQEVKVDTNSYSAEYGRASGAVVNIITKAGTNGFHGSLYEFIRNDAFDAYEWGSQAGAKKPELRQNYYGGSVGGPVWIPKLYNGRNKTFFFVDWEQFRQISGISAQPLSLPTAYEENELATNGDLDLSDLADLPISGTNSATLASLGAAQYNLPAADIDPLTRNYFLSYPKPNLPCTAAFASGCSANYVNTPPGKQNLTNLDARIDEHIGSNNLIFGRFEYEPETTVQPEEFPQISAATIAQGIYSSAASSLDGIWPGGFGTTFSGPSFTNTYGIQTDYVHIFNQNLLLDLRAGYTRINIQSQPWNYANGAATKMGWPASVNTSDALPAIGGPWASWTALEGGSNAEPIIDINNIFQYAGSVTYTHGTHNFKFGAALIRRQIHAFEDSIAGGLIFPGGNDNTGGPPFLGAMPFADDRMNYLNGNFAMILRQDDAFQPNFRVWEPSVYATDNWRVNNKLTLNLGLRYDIYSPFKEAKGNYSNFLPSCLNASATTVLSAADGAKCWAFGTTDPTIGVKTDYNDIQPRVGFAYSWDSKTVVRGAFGMTYFTPDEGQVSIGTASPESVMQNYNPISAFNNQTILPNAGPNPNPGPPIFCSVSTGTGTSHGCLETGLPQPTPMTIASVDAFASNSSLSSVSAKSTTFKNGYAEMANLAVQRQFGANTVTLAYVGSFGRHLLNLANLDLGALPGAAGAANYPNGVPYTYAAELPNVNTIGYLYNGAMSAYNSMQVIYNRRITKGLDFNTNFNWGHALTNACTSGNGCTFIPSVPSSNEYGGRPSERIAGSLAYTVPFGNSLNGVAGELIKGWKLNALGFWQSGGNLTVTGGENTDVQGAQSGRPNQIASTKVSHPTLGKWFNTAAFATATLGTLGTERTSQLLGPSARNVDLSVDKDFKIFKESVLEFRAECFNAGNIANYGNPGTTFNQAEYGVITAVQNQEREFQFAAKLKF